MPETPSLPVTARRPSLLAAGVFVFGVLLWAFVVMGELTTSYGPGKRSMLMSEALAFVLVLVAAAAAWWVALSRSVEVAPPAGAFGTYVRGAVIAGLALALWLITLFCAIALAGGGSRSLDGPITMMLLIVSLAAALGGRRLAGLHVPAPAGGARILVRLVWVAASLLTFVAFALVAET
jgi:hypothetical protein